MLDENEVFDDFMTNRVVEGAKLSDVIYLINQKLVNSCEDEKKVEVLSEVLNEIKLYLVPVPPEAVH
tara:strand:+ start:135 stop:335 length:201 start_codon:yes stop_codon:yes gene_type:complete